MFTLKALTYMYAETTEITNETTERLQATQTHFTPFSP